MPKREVGFLVRYLFAGDKGRDVLERIDRRVDRLPGQGGLHLLTRAWRASPHRAAETFDVRTLPPSPRARTAGPHCERIRR